MIVKKNNEDINLDNSLKLIAKTSFVVLIGLFFAKLFTYIFRITVARYYGPEVYGLFSLSLMVIAWFTAFVSLGFLEGILRFIPFYRGRNQINKIKYTVKLTSKIIIISGIISGVLLFLLSKYISITFFHSEELIPFLKISSILIVIWMLASLYTYIIRAYEKTSSYSFIYNILQNLLRLVFLIFLIFLGLKGEATILAYFLGAFCILVISYLFCRYKLPLIFGPCRLDRKKKKAVSREIFNYSWPTVFNSLIATIFVWIDSFSIGYFRTVADVGIYNVAIPIATLLLIAPDLFTQLFFPLVNREYVKKNFKLVKELSQQVGKWIFIINIPLLIILLLFPGAVINILFGPEYIAAENALRMLAVGNFIFSIATISYFLILVKGKTKIPLMNTSFLAALNILLNFLLVPRYGINGAAFSTTFCFTFGSIIYMFQAKKFISIVPLRRKMLTIALLSIIPTILLFFIRRVVEINLFNLIILGLFFILLYFLLILFGNGLDENDKRILKFIKNKFLGN